METRTNIGKNPAGSFIAGYKQTIDNSLDSVGYSGNPTIDPVFNSIVSMAIFRAVKYYYHYNHQGSVALVTWHNGTIRQHLQYLPYGGTFVDHRTGSYSSPYTFSAKEKDSESGYNYFGARYYTDNIMMWLSVDPMSDKNASTSPYMYCAGNPIKYKDLYGMDTIMFNRYGYFGKPIPDNSDEDTYVRVSNKEFNANKIKYKKNGGLRWYHGTLTIGKNELVKKESDYGDMYYDAGKDKNKASKIFRFFVNNTDVEWSHSIWNDDNNELLNAISTNHDAKEVDFPRLNKIPVHFFHSHPDGGQMSDQDVEILNRMMKINPNFVSTIYKGGYFTDYDVNKKEFNKRIKPW